MSDAGAAAKAMASVPVKEFALEGTRDVARVVVKIARMNLARRHGGGKYPRGRAEVISEKGNGYGGSEAGWTAVLRSPFMGMEWGGWVTNIWGQKFGSQKTRIAGFEPMWAPWHSEYKEGYIIGSAWSELSKGEATKIEADAVLKAYTVAFDEAGLKKV